MVSVVLIGSLFTWMWINVRSIFLILLVSHPSPISKTSLIVSVNIAMVTLHTNTILLGTKRTILSVVFILLISLSGFSKVTSTKISSNLRLPLSKLILVATLTLPTNRVASRLITNANDPHIPRIDVNVFPCQSNHRNDLVYPIILL